MHYIRIDSFKDPWWSQGISLQISSPCRASVKSLYLKSNHFSQACTSWSHFHKVGYIWSLARFSVSIISHVTVVQPETLFPSSYKQKYMDNLTMQSSSLGRVFRICQWAVNLSGRCGWLNQWLPFCYSAHHALHTGTDCVTWNFMLSCVLQDRVPPQLVQLLILALLL